MIRLTLSGEWQNGPSFEIVWQRSINNLLAIDLASGPELGSADRLEVHREGFNGLIISTNQVKCPTRLSPDDRRPSAGLTIP